MIYESKKGLSNFGESAGTRTKASLVLNEFDIAIDRERSNRFKNVSTTSKHFPKNT
jgi:hypothetical protein